MTIGGSQQLRIFRRAIRDGACVEDAATAAQIGIDEARLHAAQDAKNPPPPEAYNLLVEGPAVTEQPSYRAFLEAKIPTALPAGLPCDLDEVPVALVDGRPLRDHQRAIIRWAVEGGRRALFEAFGLGKSIQQIAILDLICRKAGDDALAIIVAPLGVRREFMRDAELLGVRIVFVKSDDEIDAIPVRF